MKPALINHKLRPPRGGWSVTYNIGGVDHPVGGRLAPHVVQNVIALRINNGLPRDDQGVWDYCNAVWCAREPGRCPGVLPVGSPEPIPPGEGSKDHWEVTPSEWGSSGWQMLNLFPMRFDKEQFFNAWEILNALLKDPEVGCEECLEEFSGYTMENPLINVRSEKDCALWVYGLHERVNQKLGKHRPSFDTVARSYNWKVELPSDHPSTKDNIHY